MNTNERIQIYLTGNPNITFQKGVYKRYCKFFSDTIQLNSIQEEKKRCFEIKTDLPSYTNSVLNNIFLETDNIDQIEYVDIYWKKRQDNDDDIMPVRTDLYKLNKQFIKNIFLKVEDNMYKFSYILHMFPLIMMNLTKFNFYIDIHYHSFNTNDDNIYIQYKIIEDDEELNKFRTISHEYLLKTCKYIEYNLKDGMNLINLSEFSQKELYGMVLNFDNPLIRVNGRFVTNHNDKIININKNFKSYIKVFENFENCVIIDPNENFISPHEGGYQPTGSISVGIDPYFELNSNMSGKIYITVYEYDIFRIYNDHFKTMYLLHNITEEIQARIEERNRELMPPPEPAAPVEQVVMPDFADFLPQRRLLDFGMDMSMYKNLLDTYEKNNAIEILKSDIEDDCVISMSTIEKDEYFYKCGQCSKPVKYEEMREWLNKNKSCPHCTKAFEVFPKLYICKETFSNIVEEIEYVYEESDEETDEESDEDSDKKNFFNRLYNYFIR